MPLLFSVHTERKGKPVLHAIKLTLTLTLWFAAIHLIVTAKNGVSLVELARRLGIRQPTA